MMESKFSIKSDLILYNKVDFIQKSLEVIEKTITFVA
jgi:hypothetical protein